jgi:hypothetical protein
MLCILKRTAVDYVQFWRFVTSATQCDTYIYTYRKWYAGKEWLSAPLASPSQNEDQHTLNRHNRNKRDKVSHPYKKAGKIMVLHILIHMSLYKWWEDKTILKTEVTAFLDFSLCEYNFHLLPSFTNTLILLALFCHKCVLYFGNNI